MGAGRSFSHPTPIRERVHGAAPAGVVSRISAAANAQAVAPVGAVVPIVSEPVPVDSALVFQP